MLERHKMAPEGTILLEKCPPKDLKDMSYKLFLLNNRPSKKHNVLSSPALQLYKKFKAKHGFS